MYRYTKQTTSRGLRDAAQSTPKRSTMNMHMMLVLIKDWRTSHPDFRSQCISDPYSAPLLTLHHTRQLGRDRLSLPRQPQTHSGHLTRCQGRQPDTHAPATAFAARKASPPPACDPFSFLLSLQWLRHLRDRSLEEPITFRTDFNKSVTWKSIY